MLIRKCGLAAALTSLRDAKGALAEDRPEAALLADLERALSWPSPPLLAASSLADVAVGASLDRYLALSAEILELADAFSLVAWTAP
jgi:hypothetical protein